VENGRFLLPFSHINYCLIIGKFVLGKATLEDIQSLHSRNQQEQEQEKEPEVITEEEQKQMMEDLNGITNDLENLEKNIRDTIGDEQLNEMQEQLSGIFGGMFNQSENNTENNGNPLAGVFENMQNGDNPFESMFDTDKLQKMSDDIKSKVDNGEIDEEKLKKTSEDMMKMVGKLSQNIGPLLGNMMSGLSQAENGNNEDAGLGDIGSLLGGLGGLGGLMGGMGGNSDQTTDPLSRAMSAGMQAMADKNGGDSNPLAGLMSAFTGASLTNNEKSELRAEERQEKNRREARKKYREARRKRQKQIKKQKKQMSKKTPTAKK